ncbi:MAG: CHAP domain-containing protein [Alphaproteobacteria bacterium]|nr:CHAP domain-containing protein [Alphaproteobacteria bacterium]
MAVLLAFPVAAKADVGGAADHLAGRLDGWFADLFQATEVRSQPMQPIIHPRPALTARVPTPAPMTPAALSNMDLVKVSPPPPSVEKPLRRLFCVEYARMRSGLAIMGDAKYWWKRAHNLYARLSHPVEEAVMVFSGSKRLRRGHVAVVTDIVSPREIVVDQANWQNHGEIDHSTPVLDVSTNNDWSRVRVWNIHAGQFGTHVYAISGFIAKDLVRQASND